MSKLAGIKVFVSGASGFIGSALAKRLATEGAQVSVLNRDPIRASSLRDNNIRVYWGDITYPKLLVHAMEGCKLVFHCAAAGGGSLEESRAINVEGTRNILECAKQAGVKRIVHVSSIAVYGNNLPPVVDESQPYASKPNSYALSKAEGEQLALRLGKERGIEVVVVQPTYVYGPGSPIWTMRFFQKVKEEQIVLVNNGAGLFNPVYIDDLVDSFLLSAECGAAVGERFIVSGQMPVTWREYLGCFASMCNKPTPSALPLWKARMQFRALLWHFRFTRQPMKFDFFDVQLMCNYAVFSIDKARKMLGYQPKVNLNEGMARTAKWLRGQGYLIRRSDCQ